MTPDQLHREIAEGRAQLILNLTIQKQRGHDVETMLAQVGQTQDAWVASRLEEGCPGCGAAAYEDCRPDCLGEKP